jgi:hypothetical protein
LRVMFERQRFQPDMQSLKRPRHDVHSMQIDETASRPGESIKRKTGFSAFSPTTAAPREFPRYRNKARTRMGVA